MQQPLSSSSFLCPETPDDVGPRGSDDYWDPLETSAEADAGDCAFSRLLAAEADLAPFSGPLSPNHLRLNAVNWILNVNEFYRFRPLTALLAVSYLDRFLSSNTLHGQEGESGGGGWPMQLLAVASVSVAAKMEETHVPLLLDLQILDPKFVFEPKTITRMELLLMSALNWRMRSITAFDFVDYFADFLDPELIAGSRTRLLSRAADLIVRTCRVVEFLGYRPSEIAAAAIICAGKEIGGVSDGGCGDLLRRFNECVNEDNVSVCLQLMESSFVEKFLSSRHGKPIPELRTPQSPVGVIDAAACGSCESERSSTATAPAAKRRRLDESLCTESIHIKNDEDKNLGRDQ